MPSNLADAKGVVVEVTLLNSSCEPEGFLCDAGSPHLRFVRFAPPRNQWSFHQRKDFES
jgi:hypothetical protein